MLKREDSIFRPTVFLSYTECDKAIIERIASDLRECQIDAWYDKWEISPGEHLRERILGQAIPVSDAFFVYLTPESIKSKWVQKELDAAFIEEAQDKGLCILTFVDHKDTRQKLRSDIAARNCPIINLKEYEIGFRTLIRNVTGAASERRLKELRKQVDYVLRPTLRGITLLESIKNVGLIDIENRDDDRHDVPPYEYYNQATNEVFVSGISLYRTFDKGIAPLRNILNKGLLLKVLLMRPDANEIPWLSQRESKNIRLDIESVIEAAEYEGFIGSPNFQMRFMEKFPTFTAALLDGAIEEPLSSEPIFNPQVRIQPTTIYCTHHMGLVLQLKKTSETPFPLLDFVVEELRAQWAASIDLKDLQNLK